jgi:TonB family protein
MKIRRSRLLEDRTTNWHRSVNSLDPVLLELAEEEKPVNRRALRLGLILGAIVHLVVFLIVFPSYEAKVRDIGSAPKVYVLKQLKFSPPKAPAKRSQPVAKPRAKKIPIPDPTPDDPEPLFEDAVDGPDMDFPEVSFGDVAAIPDAPPGPSVSVYQISGNVKAPEKISAPDPVYTEEARMARIQGVVILQTIIDIAGNVTNIRVLKGLPSGLTESAIEAVESWRFRPATLEGEAVPVHYMITISFSVQ